jgi:hypothetical protein
VPDRQFDAAICLCEGAICLLNPGDDPNTHDLAILRNVSAALSSGAPFIMTTLNAYRDIRSATQADVESGAFDPVTMVHTVSEEMDIPGGAVTFHFRERKFIVPELARLLNEAGFDVEHVWGGTAGNWGRRSIDLDEIEIMIVARKRAILSC